MFKNKIIKHFKLLYLFYVSHSKQAKNKQKLKFLIYEITFFLILILKFKVKEEKHGFKKDVIFKKLLLFFFLVFFTLFCFRVFLANIINICFTLS